MSSRQRLPCRRPSITREAVWHRPGGVHRFTVTVGIDPGTREVREVFASPARGSDIDALIADSCVGISHALQCGADPIAIARSMLRVEATVDGEVVELRASAFGAIADCVAEVVVWLREGGP